MSGVLCEGKLVTFGGVLSGKGCNTVHILDFGEHNSSYFGGGGGSFSIFSFFLLSFASSSLVSPLYVCKPCPFHAYHKVTLCSWWVAKIT